MWPAVGIGGLLPLVLPLYLLATGFIIENARIKLAGWAIGQAELIGAFIAAAYKAFTGRVHILRTSSATDISHVFRFGWLRGGVFWGWPSSHATIAFAMAVDGVHALSETTVAGFGGDPLRFLCRHWCFHDHPLVLGFRGRSDHWLGHRSRGREKFCPPIRLSHRFSQMKHRLKIICANPCSSVASFSRPNRLVHGQLNRFLQRQLARHHPFHSSRRNRGRIARPPCGDNATAGR